MVQEPKVLLVIRVHKALLVILEMLALKIWARDRAPPFPSFLQELATIAALQPGQPISQAFDRLLHYLATDFQTARLTDPANSNHIVSDVLFPSQKSSITAAIRHQTHESPEFPRGSLNLIGRRPTLPHTRACSTIGAERLNFRVRDGNGWDPLARITQKGFELLEE